VRFWDSSAIVPLLVAEPTTVAVLRTLEADTEIVVWWATGIECVSAFARLEREGALTPDEVAVAGARLDRLLAVADEIQPAEILRRTATRLLRVHALRAAGALQLAAARAASEDRPETLFFVTLDDRLGVAAQREGFEVIRPAA